MCRKNANCVSVASDKLGFGRSMYHCVFQGPGYWCTRHSRKRGDAQGSAGKGEKETPQPRKMRRTFSTRNAEMTPPALLLRPLLLAAALPASPGKGCRHMTRYVSLAPAVKAAMVGAEAQGAVHGPGSSVPAAAVQPSLFRLAASQPCCSSSIPHTTTTQASICHRVHALPDLQAALCPGAPPKLTLPEHTGSPQQPADPVHTPAPLMKALEPLISKPPSTGMAVVLSDAASDPLPGSVRQ